MEQHNEIINNSKTLASTEIDTNMKIKDEPIYSYTDELASTTEVAKAPLVKTELNSDSETNGDKAIDSHVFDEILQAKDVNSNAVTEKQLTPQQTLTEEDPLSENNIIIKEEIVTPLICESSQLIPNSSFKKSPNSKETSKSTQKRKIYVEKECSEKQEKLDNDVEDDINEKRAKRKEQHQLMAENHKLKMKILELKKQRLLLELEMLNTKKY